MMQIERAEEFNLHTPVNAAVDVAFYWKASARVEGGFNAFWPELLTRLNRKTSALYELLGNTMLELPRPEDLTHTVKVQGEWTLIENVVEAEEMSELTQRPSLLAKTESQGVSRA